MGWRGRLRNNFSENTQKRGRDRIGRCPSFACCRCLLFVELNYLDGVAGDGVVEMVGDALQGGFDGDDSGWVVDGVGGLCAGGAEGDQDASLSQFCAGQVDVERFRGGFGIDELEVEAFFGGVAGDGVEELWVGGVKGGVVDL